MTVTTAQTRIVPQSPSRLARTLTTGNIWLVGVLSAVAGALVTEAFALVARASGVPMEAAGSGATEAAEIPVGGFAGGVLFWSVVGIVLAPALARWAGRPARTFVAITVPLTALSMIAPALAPHTATSTQIILALSHVVAAAVIIPPLARRLSAQHR
ncbi:DUF6069 family protein [Streptomyces sp. NPDC057877]|uniref:DUF6069 family protein n=1 Tax=Streptomyces sp. NPDC057877 TaxID=3346269 RepID=UPI003678A1B7